jgi:hypothetical protein
VSVPQLDGAEVLLVVPAQQPDRHTTLTYAGDTSIKLGSPAHLAARLVDATGAPLVGEPIAFAFRGVTYSATTGSDGVASVTTARVTGPPGAYDVTADYAGSSAHLPSTVTARLTVTSKG